MIDFNSTTPPSDKTINDALLDFGLNHSVQTAIRMYAEYKNHGRYWYPGAGVDQPDEFWEDISTMNWLNLYIEHVLPKAQFQKQFNTEDVITRLQRGESLL